ncbi:cell division control protein 6 homolog isoform X2 [Coccinella septempunctata]|uniref:cell division control protein 6 homolog isoform X2 n=1 Tax=Coccinella septempunctata TaxID=41139 RepID=UPI001D05C8AF|nr:cell division control protein 6 homolog isoform X2 [Coccinella septempunctata]
MSRRSSRLSAKSQVQNEIRCNSPSLKKSSRTSNRTNPLSSAPVEEPNVSEVKIVLNRNVLKTSDKSNDSCYGSSNDDSSSTEESITTVKTTYYNSPGKRKTALELDENISRTPPKQRKLNNEDDEENKIISPKTPSSLLSKLALSSPSIKQEDCSSRKSLWPSSSIYQDAKRALHSTTPEAMPGRQKEFEELEFFIKEHLEEKRSGSLYISGPPGTGKTACLTLILENSKIEKDFKKVYVNCTSIKSAGTIYSRIIKDLGVKGTARSEKEYLSLIEKHFLNSKKMNLLVLDEMDQLESRNQSVLYTIFEWPARFKDNVVLIGIANALDLTDRILPRLQARCELKPQLLHFTPYSKQQILEIITSRLEAADAVKEM